MTGQAQRGEVPWVMLVIIAAGLAGVYTILAYGGAYMESLKVKEEMTLVVNEFGRTKDPERIRDRLMFRLEKILTETAVDEDGEQQTVYPLRPAEPEQIEVTFDEAAAKVKVRYSYIRTVKLPFIGRPSQISFAPEVEGDLATAAPQP